MRPRAFVYAPPNWSGRLRRPPLSLPGPAGEQRGPRGTTEKVTGLPDRRPSCSRGRGGRVDGGPSCGRALCPPLPPELEEADRRRMVQKPGCSGPEAKLRARSKWRPC
ncbi:hypothetical protein NDU88_004981 [Pleurodeles waltl]|uniref:Uncharacterized protein n=1 Tax=Pleurodeles waltl TaxID=8319 RepID=A0AAV7T939_PLEWA|nr:hypothetical protein NDU88_004981 [Pleurodeles waltl]